MPVKRLQKCLRHYTKPLNKFICDKKQKTIYIPTKEVPLSQSNAIPTLYPTLNSAQLEEFFTDSDYAYTKTFDNIYILPFVSQKSDSDELFFGLGLSRLIIRNLMLLRDVSIHGPEDTAEVTYESIHRMVETHPKSGFVSGVAQIGEGEFSLYVEAHRPGQTVNRIKIQHQDFQLFLRDCSFAIARLLECPVEEAVADAWKVGQPRDLKSLMQVGEIQATPQNRVERAQAIQQLLDYDPDFVIAVWDIDSELADAQQYFLAGLERDPYNAQLCFLAFCAIWDSRDAQPEAFQYCRKAIELSPGHGKAHMCIPHTASFPEKLLHHSELGYRLLPGNSFAVSNYGLYLNRAGVPISKKIELAEESLSADPRNPSSYEGLIALYTSIHDYECALVVAEKLQQLYEPEIDARAMYCLRQNPKVAKSLDSGEYNPGAENRQRIEALRKRL
jgi:tetratricopeptide (TPR) repeat protein